MKKKLMLLIMVALLTLNIQSALAWGYTAEEVEEIQSLIGRYSIQSVVDITKGVDIGLSDMSKVEEVKDAVLSMWISTEYLTFHYEDPRYLNNWYEDYGELGDARIPVSMLSLIAIFAISGILVVHKKRKNI